MSKKEKYDSLESMMDAAHEAIDLIGNSSTKDEMRRNTINGLTLSRHLIDLIEQNLLSNSREIQEANCQCPVCAVAQKRVKEEIESIITLKKSIGKIEPEEHDDPFGAVILLNTVRVLLVHIPKLIMTMSEMVGEAHEMGRMLITGKIVKLHLETQDDDEPCCDCGACERPDKIQN